MNFQAYMAALSPETAAQVGSFYGYPQGGNAYSQIDPYAYSDLGRDEKPADKLYADIIRAQTQDYMNRFAPVENDLISRITPTGTTSLAGDLQRTQQAVLGAGMNVQGQQNRSMERLGLYGNSSIGNGNDTVGALIGGLNDTRMRDTDRRMQLLTGVGGAVAQRARSNIS